MDILIVKRDGKKEKRRFYANANLVPPSDSRNLKNTVNKVPSLQDDVQPVPQGQYFINRRIYPTDRINYIKLGKYIEELGGLNSPTTSQRLYQIENETMIDITNKFYK